MIKTRSSHKMKFVFVDLKEQFIKAIEEHFSHQENVTAMVIRVEELPRTNTAFDFVWAVPPKQKRFFYWLRQEKNRLPGQLLMLHGRRDRLRVQP